MNTHTGRIEGENAAADATRGQKGFAKIYDKGWVTIRDLSANPMALKVYSFIAQHCDHLNALVCPIDVMAEEFNCSNRTIIRATKWLQDNKHLAIVKVGTANAYVLDHRDLWKNYDKYKGYCAFNATTLASKAQNKRLKQRLTHMSGQRDLFDAETGEVL